jgi:hypothetical protein
MHGNRNVQPVNVIALEFQRCASQHYGVVQCLMDQMVNYYGIWWLPYECFVLYVSFNLFSTQLHLRLAVVPLTVVRQANDDSKVQHRLRSLEPWQQVSSKISHWTFETPGHQSIESVDKSGNGNAKMG